MSGMITNRATPWPKPCATAITPEPGVPSPQGVLKSFDPQVMRVGTVTSGESSAGTTSSNCLP